MKYWNPEGFFSSASASARRLAIAAVTCVLLLPSSASADVASDIFEREFGWRVTLPDNEPHYRAKLTWNTSLYSRGSHTVTRVDGAEDSE